MFIYITTWQLRSGELKKKVSDRQYFFVKNVNHAVIYNNEKVNANRMSPSPKIEDWLNTYFTLINIMF